MAIELEVAKKKKYKILLIEDDIFFVKIYQAKLQNEDIEVLVANDGLEALKFLEKDPPNLVILDFMLPQVSGYDVLEAIRKNDKWKNVPIIALTNLSQEEDMKRAQEMGVSDYMVKSTVTVENILQKIKKLLEIS